MSFESRQQLTTHLHALQAARNFHYLTLQYSKNRQDRANAVNELKKLNFEIKRVHKKLFGS